MQADDGEARRDGIGERVVRRETPGGRRRGRGLGEEALHRARAGALPEARPADGRDLVRVERRVLAPEVDDRLADRRGELSVALYFGRRGEAGHPPLVEGVGLAVEGALRHAGLAGADAGGLPEEDDGADELVGALLGRLGEQLELLPVIRRRHLLPLHPDRPLTTGAVSAACQLPPCPRHRTA